MKTRVCPHCHTASSASNCPVCGWDFTLDCCNSPSLDCLEASELKGVFSKRTWTEQKDARINEVSSNTNNTNNTSNIKNANNTNKSRSFIRRSIVVALLIVIGIVISLKKGFVVIGGRVYVLFTTSTTKLDLSRQGITDISELAKFTNLTSLNLEQNHITDVTPLGSLTGLQWLELDSNPIADISPLANLSSLETLYIEDTNVTDYSVLDSLPALETLKMWDFSK